MSELSKLLLQVCVPCALPNELTIGLFSGQFPVFCLLLSTLQLDLVFECATLMCIVGWLVNYEWETTCSVNLEFGSGRWTWCSEFVWMIRPERLLYGTTSSAFCRKNRFLQQACLLQSIIGDNASFQLFWEASVLAAQYWSRRETLTLRVLLVWNVNAPGWIFFKGVRIRRLFTGVLLRLNSYLAHFF